MSLRRNSGWLLVAASMLGAALASQAAEVAATVDPDSDAATLATLVRLTEEIEESIRTGDRSVLERHGAPEMLLVNRDGRTYTKQEFIGMLDPPRPGYELRFEVREPKLLRHGDSAVLTFLLAESLRIHGHDVSTNYRCTFAYFRRAGRWQLVLFEYFEKPEDPPVVKVDTTSLDAHAGTYELAPGKWVTRVWRDGERLLASRDGGNPKPLLPTAGGRFFYPGVEGEIFFESGDAGRFMVFRRNGKDLRYQGVKSSPTVADPGKTHR